MQVTTVVVIVLVVLASGVLLGLVVARFSMGVARAPSSEAVDPTRLAEMVVALAGEQFGHHLRRGGDELAHHRSGIEQQVGGLNHEVERLTDLVVQLQRDRAVERRDAAEQHGLVVAGLRETVNQGRVLAETTQSLREALASPKARGQWGERMADDVLRLAGFVEGISYVRHAATRHGTIPDFTFLLPNDLVVHMDVKFPIDNYLRHLDATSDADADAFRDRFLRDVRDRVKELGGRGYIDPPQTVDHVLLFIPNEAVYSFVHGNDPRLADLALSERVVLCSPFTLFAVLGVIRRVVDDVAFERTSDQILASLAAFGDQWDRFGESIDLVGKRLESTSRAFDDLNGPRRRQMQKRLDEIAELRTSHHPDQVPLDDPTDQLPGSNAWR